jgi:hypothetical protein
MGNQINTILDYHKIRSLGSRQNAKVCAENVRSAYNELFVQEQAELAVSATLYQQS